MAIAVDYPAALPLVVDMEFFTQKQGAFTDAFAS
jgi:DNA-binding NtrC family response regulator